MTKQTTLSTMDKIMAHVERLRRQREAEYRFITGLQGKPFNARTIAAIDRELTAPDPGLEK